MSEYQGQEDFYDNINNQEAVEVKTEWSTEELTQEFKVLGFAHGYCAVKRKSDGVKGSLDFEGRPRKYFGFQPQ
jgi:hypothetical protein